MCMISEGITRRIDSTGRVSIPKHLRNKYSCNEGDEVEIFTTEIDGKVFICISPVEGQHQPMQLLVRC
jgi:AbrB family looped-hinge helix DNA binding protein